MKCPFWPYFLAVFSTILFSQPWQLPEQPAHPPQHCPLWSLCNWLLKIKNDAITMIEIMTKSAISVHPFRVPAANWEPLSFIVYGFFPRLSSADRLLSKNILYGRQNCYKNVNSRLTVAVSAIPIHDSATALRCSDSSAPTAGWFGKAPADVFSVKYIWMSTLPKTIPNILRHVEIAPDTVIPVQANLQNCPLCIIANSVN